MKRLQLSLACCLAICSCTVENVSDDDDIGGSGQGSNEEPESGTGRAEGGTSDSSAPDPSDPDPDPSDPGPSDPDPSDTDPSDPDPSRGDSSGADEPASDQIFLDDDFSDGRSGWTDQAAVGFTTAIDPVEGPTPPSFRIEGNTENWVESTTNGITKVVDISGWSSERLVLSADYRALSNTDASNVTNARIQVFDADTDELLVVVTPPTGGGIDSGWRSVDQNIAEEVDAANSSSLRILLYVQDSWVRDWQHQTWFDNVKLLGSN